MISGRDIVCISSIEWDFLWQGHQEIATRFAAAGNRVLYIENTGVRAPGLRDAGRVAGRLRRWLDLLRTGGVRQIEPNLYVCSPLILPPFGPPWRRRLNRRFCLRAIARTVRRLGMRDPVVWTYLPTDTALDLMRLLRTPRGVAAYYCIADFSELTPHREQLRHSEAAVIGLCDVVFAQGPEIAEHCRQWNDNVHIFPFGVNLEAFPLEPRRREALRGEELAPLARPVIGYIGGLHRHVDFPLLVAMARARPEWSWVFVGPEQAAVGELAHLPNVHLLGQQPHGDLADFVRQFDVGIVPYAVNPYTDTVVPTKINEYLALGKPVVATPLPPVREFNARYDVLMIAENEPVVFLAALERALEAPRDAETIARRRTAAEQADWGEQLEAMSAHLAAAPARKGCG